MSPRIEFYGTDGSVYTPQSNPKRPQLQGGSIPHRILKNDVTELGDKVQLTFEAVNSQHLNPGDPERKQVVVPLSTYANLNLDQPVQVFRSKTTPAGYNRRQKPEIKFYVGLDLQG